MKNFIFSLVCLCFTLGLAAQDRIIKMDKTEILCKVTEVGTSEIKYLKYDNLDGPVYTISRTDVYKIIFANGTEEIIQPNSMSVVPGNKTRHYKRAITTRPFGPLIGFVCLGYQQALTPTRAVIGEVGYIGAKIGDLGERSQGAYIRVGFRLKRTPEVVMPGMEWGYNLGGFYVQPELTFSAFSTNQQRYIYDPNTGMGTVVNEKVNYNSGAFMITLGRQMIAGEICTFDISGSIGYAKSSGGDTGIYDFGLPRIYYSHSAGGESMPIAWKFTFSMGILMK
ncbi:MAG TPA: hypothetical protein VK826_06400 [Bacteroidia bacterium]|nr:hypothetical protein [Bacteroidia bacterium]